MHLVTFRSAIGLALTASLLVGGCAGTTQPSNFYMLNGAASAVPAGVSEGGEIALGIGPVKLPKYLDRPQIVIRTTPNELKVSEYNRWAEPLDSNLTRVVAENLSTLLGTDQVVFHPWQRSIPVDFQVSLEVLRFDTTAGGEVHLHTLWSLLRDDGRVLLLSKQSNITESAESAADYAAVVAAQSRAIAKLSSEIADAIKGLRRQGRVGVMAGTAQPTR